VRSILVSLTVLLLALFTHGEARAQVTYGNPVKVFGQVRPGYAAASAPVDFNNDGFDDLILAYSYFPLEDKEIPLLILLNDGKGAFTDGTAAVIDGLVPATVSPRAIVVADFNKDGRPDVFLTDLGLDAPPFPGAQNRLLLSRADGRYVDATANLPQARDFTHTAAAADIDGSGNVAIFVGNPNQGAVPPKLLINDGSGRFTEAQGRFPPQFFTSPDAYAQVAFIDITGDECPDLILGGEGATTSAVLINDCNGNFSVRANALPPKLFPNAIVYDIRAVRLGNSGKADLLFGYVSANVQGKGIQVLINRGDGTFEDQTSARVPSFNNPNAFDWLAWLVPFDATGDCRLGLFPKSGGATSTTILIDDGSGIFRPKPSNTPNVFSKPELIDIDNDGRMDFFSSGAVEDGFYLVRASSGPSCAGLSLAATPRQRSVARGETAKISVAISNPTAATAQSCRIGLASKPVGAFSYRRADAAGTAVGRLNPTFDLPVNATQSFEVSITPDRALTSDVMLSVQCHSHRVAAANVKANAIHLTALPDNTSLRSGPVYSTLQASSQSFLRFANTGTGSGSVTVTLADSATGDVLANWTSPAIAPNAAPQYPISLIENEAGQGFVKSNYYSIAVQSQFGGTFQHVLWRPSDGTLTNLSTCNSGVTALTGRVASVHSSLLSANYPSSIVIANTGSSAMAATLGIYDGRNGTRLGTYTSIAAPANGQVTVSVDKIERGAGIAPVAGMFQYVVKIEGAFAGHLQHLVNNTQVGVITDMTTVCDLQLGPSAPASGNLRQSAIFSTAQTASQSFLRFANTGSAGGMVVVRLADSATGTTLTEWTSPSIPPSAAPQFPISTIENAAGTSFVKPNFYAISVQSQFGGTFQHVLWRPSDGTLTNLSTCNAGVTARTDRVGNVHSSLLSTNYPSSIVIANTGNSATAATLGVYDGRNGSKLGSYTAAAVPANGQLIISIDTIERGAAIVPTADMYQYALQIEGSFTGYLQHLVNNTQVGVITDMTTVCALN